MTLEMSQHSQSSFIGLTYSDDKYPEDGSLSPRTLTLFLKRIRKAHSLPLRFFGVGEYGGTTGRAHYHLALFGYPFCTFGGTRLHRNSCCYWCDLLRDTWGLGSVHSGPLTGDSALYLTGYIAKKWTKPDLPELFGRHPEFSRKSQGIGRGFVSNIAETIEKHNLHLSQPDVPAALRHGPKSQPLGRYLRFKLREHLGYSDPHKATPEAVQVQKAELRALQDHAISLGKTPQEYRKEINKQKILTAEFRMKLKKRKD